MPTSSRGARLLAPFSPEAVDRTAYRRLREACLRYGALPAFCHGIVLNLAMVAADDPAALAEFRRLTHQEVRSFAISGHDLDRAIMVMEADPERPPCAPLPAPPACPQSWETHRHTPRAVVARLVHYAFAAGASDLLVDEQAAWFEIAIKRDGRKEILPPIDKAFGAGVFKAFKEICGLATQTVTIAQAGAASLEVADGARADLRVEVTPTVHGASLVARVQDRARQLQRMKTLPFVSAEQRRIMTTCLQQPQGLIVVTGPTGHGKTSTLYACLGQLDPAALNIRTLEDPVEFVVPWITQIPVGEGTGRSFADGLKSLLRQSPHVILLGEIRDRSAAAIAIEAVETGHLILATLHTRDAIGVVSRLLDLGLSGRQIAAGLRLAVGQRLIRRLCPECRRPAAPNAMQRRHFAAYGLMPPPVLYTPGGCTGCRHQGERGVVPAFEFFYPGTDGGLEDRLAQATPARFSERHLRQQWRAAGGSPLVREGLLLVAAGEVAHAEVLRYEEDAGAWT